MTEMQNGGRETEALGIQVSQSFLWNGLYGHLRLSSIDCPPVYRVLTQFYVNPEQNMSISQLN